MSTQTGQQSIKKGRLGADPGGGVAKLKNNHAAERRRQKQKASPPKPSRASEEGSGTRTSRRLSLLMISAPPGAMLISHSNAQVTAPGPTGPEASLSVSPVGLPFNLAK